MHDRLDTDTFYAAMARRDPEFEGVFYVGVRTTGVFCRPTCPAPPPKKKNCEFFTDAHLAMLAGFRPCKRCRPLSYPNKTSAVVEGLVAAVERDPARR
jgi:AraC family transcriptional regulator of adaptative response/methylated-DNA-[protein]-cysteine methyltransferase